MMAKCISRIRVRHGEVFHDVPCGRCNFCLQNRRKEWSFRLQKELRQHSSAFFLTLTYHDLAVPQQAVIHNDIEINVPVLRKEDFQKFMKRLRKRHSKYSQSKIKYYAVGEYGSTTARPHYHAIVFGLHKQVVSHIGTIWVDGFVHCGAVNNDSIDYVTKYVVNKYDFKDYPVPPFSLISNGIGLKHFDQNQKLYKHESKVVNNRGYPQVLPRYYRGKLNVSPFTSEIAKAKARIESDKREQQELERLSRLHPDPDAYLREKEVASHDRINKQAKKGESL